MYTYVRCLFPNHSIVQYQPHELFIVRVRAKNFTERYLWIKEDN